MPKCICSFIKKIDFYQGTTVDIFVKRCVLKNFFFSLDLYCLILQIWYLDIKKNNICWFVGVVSLCITSRVLVLFQHIWSEFTNNFILPYLREKRNFEIKHSSQRNKSFCRKTRNWCSGFDLVEKDPRFSIRNIRK